MNVTNLIMYFAVAIIIIIVILATFSQHFKATAKIVAADKVIAANRESNDMIQLRISRIRYTRAMMTLIDQLINTAVLFRLHQQFGTLPIEKLTAIAMNNIIAQVATDVHNAIDVNELTSGSTVSVAYIDQHIVNATILAVDNTVTSVVNTNQA